METLEKIQKEIEAHNEQTRNFYLKVIAKHGIDPSIVGTRENHEKEGVNVTDVVASACIEILTLAGIDKKYARAAYYGIHPINCDGELGYYKANPDSPWNFGTLYDGCALRESIELAIQYLNKSTQYEVGLKYPRFKKELLIKKYGLTFNGVFSIVYRNIFDKTAPPTISKYSVWQNEEKTITFSFEYVEDENGKEIDRIGKGGYAGAVFPTIKESYDFAKWYLKHSSFYIKDMDLFRNGLGGLSIELIDMFNQGLTEYRR